MDSRTAGQGPAKDTHYPGSGRVIVNEHWPPLAPPAAIPATVIGTEVRRKPAVRADASEQTRPAPTRQ
jgi:hypothetical protein